MFDSQLAADWLKAFKPPERIAPSAFAEREIRLAASANALPGPLRLTSYQREIVDAIADDETEFIVLQLSSQVGKSLAVLAMMAYAIGVDPGPMMHVSPTTAKSEEFVRDRFDTLVADSPLLRELVGKGQSTRKGSTGGINSVSGKSFPGGQIAFASSFKSDDLAARSVRYLFLDEIDRFARTVGVEGDPIPLAVKRTTAYQGKRRKIVIVSTPTTRMGSRINAWFLRGDQRKFTVTCPDCKVAAPLEIERLHREKGKPESAELQCEACGALHDDATRRAMVEAGKWVPTATGEPGIRSYHMGELASLIPPTTNILEKVARDYEAADSPEAKQAFYNTSLARVYDAGTEVELSPIALEARAEPIKPPYAVDIVFVTAGVDVQRDRLEVSFLAHHADGTGSVLNHLKLTGDTTADAVWRDLDAALGTTFPLANGNMLSVYVTAVDSGYSADQVLRFVHSQRAKSRAVYPAKGVGGFDRLPIVRGGRLKGQTGLLLIGVDRMKGEIQKRLSVEPNEPGYIRLPDHLPEEYFNGLASEELVARPVRGVLRYEYRKTNRQNEPFDCLIYAAAISKTVDVKRILNPPASKQFDAEAFKQQVAAFAKQTRG